MTDSTLTADQAVPPGDQADDHGHSHLGLALVLITAAQLMVVLDATVVNIALPHIQTSLGFSQQNLQWIVTGYTLAFGGLLLLGGRSGDLLGRRRMFIVGVLLFSFASGLGGLADELVQDVFLKVWLSRDKVQHVLRFDSWLFIIARNQVFDTLKLLAKEDSARKQMANLLDQDSNTVEDQLLTKENELRLQEALSRLSPQQKLIFTLSRHQGMKHEEIASRLNISRNTVKTHLVHALKTLRGTLHFHSDTLLPILLFLHYLFHR